MKTLRELAEDVKAFKYMPDLEVMDKFRTACSPDAILALMDERDALKADAARYRWLMNNCGFGIRRNGVHELTAAFYILQPDCIGDMDAAIDAALGAKP